MARHLVDLESSARGIGMTSQRTRQRLVERLRRAGVTNESVLEVILRLPRHLFVEEALASRAYEDIALPIGFGQTISQPLLVGLMTQVVLAGRPLNRVLEIGTGSGYQTAVLASLAQRVYSVERISSLLERSRLRLQQLGIYNVRLRYGDGQEGWSRHSPFDAVLVTAASAVLPKCLPEQLAPGGILVAPVGSADCQELIRIERLTNSFEKRVLCPVSFVPLLGGVC